MYGPKDTITPTGRFVPALVFVGVLLAPVSRALHGDARFAKHQEVKQAGLLGEPGLILGKWDDRFIMLLDVWQESYRIISGFRSTFSETFLFNPVAEDGRTMQWNPLSFVRDDPVLRINDAQKIENMPSPDPPDGDPFWPVFCRTLFLCLAIDLFETPRLPQTFGEIVGKLCTVKATR